MKTIRIRWLASIHPNQLSDELPKATFWLIDIFILELHTDYRAVVTCSPFCDRLKGAGGTSAYTMLSDDRAVSYVIVDPFRGQVLGNQKFNCKDSH